MTETATAIGTANALTHAYDVLTVASGTGESFYSIWSRRIQAAHWSTDCARQIDRLRELRPNWDSYGANAIDSDSIELAKRLIRSFAEVSDVCCPRVAASPAGYVALTWEWHNGSRELDLEILPDGVLRFAYLDDNDPNTEVEDETADPNQIVQLLTHL